LAQAISAQVRLPGHIWCHRGSIPDWGHAAMLREAAATLLAVLVYIPTLLWHKVGLFLAGRRVNAMLRGSGLGIPTRRLVFHDWSKFTPAELTPYARRWFGNNLEANALGRLVARTPLPSWLPVAYTEAEWGKALHHHYRYQDHHLEHWRSFRAGEPMCDEAAVEMVADWMAAEWGYEGRWPEPGRWSWLDGGTLGRMQFPDARSKAVFFAVFCVAGFGPSFEASGYSWEDAEEALGAPLARRLRSLS